MKHTGSKFKQSTTDSHTIPQPLALAAEHILLDRMALGEEVGMDLVQSVLQFIIKIWNEKVHEFKEQLLAVSGPEILAQQDALLGSRGEEASGEQEVAAVSGKMSKLMSALTTVNLTQNRSALTKLCCANSTGSGGCTGIESDDENRYCFDDI